MAVRTISFIDARTLNILLNHWSNILSWIKAFFGAFSDPNADALDRDDQRLQLLSGALYALQNSDKTASLLHNPDVYELIARMWLEEHKKYPHQPNAALLIAMLLQDTDTRPRIALEVKKLFNDDPDALARIAISRLHYVVHHVRPDGMQKTCVQIVSPHDVAMLLTFINEEYRSALMSRGLLILATKALEILAVYSSTKFLTALKWAWVAYQNEVLVVSGNLGAQFMGQVVRNGFLTAALHYSRVLEWNLGDLPQLDIAEMLEEAIPNHLSVYSINYNLEAILQSFPPPEVNPDLTRSHLRRAWITLEERLLEYSILRRMFLLFYESEGCEIVRVFFSNYGVLLIQSPSVIVYPIRHRFSLAAVVEA